MNRSALASTSLLAIALLAGACTKERPPPAASAQASTNGAGMMGMSGMEASCPMEVPGTAVQMGDTPDGMSMTFTTTSGDVSDLRTRVRAMAEHMNSRSSGGAMMMMMGDAGTGMMMGPGMAGGYGMMDSDGAHPGPKMGQGAEAAHGMAGGGDGGSGMMMGHGIGMMGGGKGAGSHMMMPVRASVEDVAGGARLRVTPVDASRLEEMKQHMHQHGEMMNEKHGCMMGRRD